MTMTAMELAFQAKRAQAIRSTPTGASQGRTSTKEQSYV
jgi:hypothetical protein